MRWKAVFYAALALCAMFLVGVTSPEVVEAGQTFFLTRSHDGAYSTVRVYSDSCGGVSARAYSDACGVSRRYSDSCAASSYSDSCGGVAKVRTKTRVRKVRAPRRTRVYEGCDMSQYSGACDMSQYSRAQLQLQAAPPAPEAPPTP